MEKKANPAETRKTAVYLKFNQVTANSLKCLNFWIEVFQKFPYPVFILCDIDKATQNIVFPEGILSRVIPSEEELRLRLANRLQKNWVNAGAAHLTTFLHAQRNGFTYYWNIDADDTMFFHAPDAIAAKLAEIEEYAVANKLDCFSLDMYRTFQKHWSFGVTFTSMANVDYFALIDRIKDGELADLYKPEHDGKPAIIDGLGVFIPGFCGNIDWYFTYMCDQALINAKSFYIEDAYFAHLKYSPIYDHIGQLVNGIYHWENGKLWDRAVAPDCIRFSKL